VFSFFSFLTQMFRTVVLAVFLFYGIVAQDATLVVCIPVGKSFSCQGSFNYTGPFVGEQVVISSFTALDGGYVPLNPLLIYTNLSRSILAQSLGSNPAGTPYTISKLFAAGSCLSSAVTAQVDGCGNYLGAVTIPSGVVGSTFDTCGNTTGTTYYPWLCPLNSGKGVTGVMLDSAARMHVANSSVPSVYLGNISYTVDALSGNVYSDLSVISDVTKPIWIDGISFPAMSGSLFPFWLKNATGVYIPNTKYWNLYNANHNIGKDWQSYLMPGFGNDTLQSVGVLTIGGSDLILQSKIRNNLFCSGVDFVCNHDGTITVIGAPIITDDLLTLLPDNIVFSNDTVRSYISSTAPLGNITATIGFTALFNRLPPTVVLTSASGSKADAYVQVYGFNSGNAGLFEFVVSYTVGINATRVESVGSGKFSFVIDSARVARVCAHSSCIIVNYADFELAASSNTSLPVVSDLSVADQWFNVSLPVSYALEVILVVFGGVAFIISSVMIYRFVMRRRRATGYGVSKRAF